MNDFRHIITSANLDGKSSSLLKLSELIKEKQPLICLLQDIPKLSKDNLLGICNTVAIDYEPVFDERTLLRHKTLDNLILLDQERIRLREIHIYDHRSKASALGISISRISYNEEDSTDEEEDDDRTIIGKEYGMLTLFSVYIRPRASYQETKDCLEWIDETSRKSDGHSRTIVMGDMNASEMTWCPTEEILENKENSEGHYRQIKLVRGRLLARMFDNMKLTCLNDVNQGPTFEAAQGNSYLDLAFVGNKAIRTWNKLTLNPLWQSPAHKVLIIEAKTPIRPIYKRKTYKRINSDMITADHFLEAHIKCDQICVNWKHLTRDKIIKRMNRLTTVLYEAIKSTQQKITTRTTIKRHGRTRNNIRVANNSTTRHQLHRLWKREARISRIRHRIRKYHDNSTKQQDLLLKRALKQKASGLRRRIINNMNTENIQSRHENLSEQDLWNKIHLVEDTLERDKNNVTAHLLKSTSQINLLAYEKFPFKRRESKYYVQNAYDKSKSALNIEINDQEISTAIHNLRSKTYTTSEGIRMNVFYKSIPHVLNIVQAIVKMSFWTCCVPEKTGATQGTLIPKKAPGQYRIVHVSSAMATLLELVALRRLEYRLEINHLNSPYQFGFSALTSRHDLIARVMEFFYKEYLEQGTDASGLIISLDIEGAFDNVNQDKLIRKMDIELAEDPIKYWLADFILNRNISIRAGTLKSERINVCLGVPQGSALGPILWNYMVHDIDVGIAKPTRAELVRYADDIILIYNGKDKQEAQTTLNKLVEKLRNIELNIRPEKCSVMGIKLGKHDWRLNSYHIGGAELKRVNRMNILGVPITNKLKLDRQSPEHVTKLRNSIKRLHNINKLGIINSAKEWRTLLESYINSRLIANNWPILILDRHSCSWVDHIVIKTLRTIFGWPANTSIKLIRLITASLNCRQTVIRTAKYRSLTEFETIYTFLLKISEPNIAKEIAELPRETKINRGLLTPRLNLETGITRHRKHPNPAKPLHIKEVSCIITETETCGPTWILLDREMGSMMAEISNDSVILQLKLGRHNEYPISYFNSFALILKTVSDTTQTNRTITLSESNSILRALENQHNRDWRVIQLREKMADNGWRINKISNHAEGALRSALAKSYKNITLIHEGNPINDFRLWLAFTENSVNPETGNNTNATRPSYRVESLNEPYLLDYKQENQINKWAPAEDKSFFIACNTNTTRALNINPEIWQSITPNWLDGAKMLVLGGMSCNADGQLQYCGDESTATCHLCEQPNENDPLNDAESSADDWHGLDSETINSNLVLHKTFTCRANRAKREEFLSRTRIELASERASLNGREILEQILTNKRACQRFLRLMVKCNTNAQTRQHN